ncbi:Chz1p KNAG_0E01450 [Huiozyma naganishii CBS 8797]|uniref:Histone H2A.Z-specific chaperone CHZ1 n=1 Tax=Huiozyma naganishii (strain ATCC MYA-139 / BCRC 22969 / CBS 8797 / KCTC 17520 / NBRC 10181 / NCYC 3082 / Yp74L-3) TaxID=1071383 RepID=J7S6I9_HUIN7|nr:hypothetical protein KNAG_0E01450 [Kazachstania naganishii CBS 8797]CCK70409.1 hypothetical protein KNAG_0E01450 [Kazachstania naganishii CBS 8797]
MVVEKKDTVVNEREKEVNKVDTTKPATESSEITKKSKRTRRRNYDDYDAEVNKDEQDSKKQKQKGTVSDQTKATSTNLGDDDDDDDDDDSDIDDAKLDQFVGVEEEDEDDLAEIDTSNIITGGRRTRGKIIDYKKTAKELDAKSGGTSTTGDTEEEETDDADFKA